MNESFLNGRVELHSGDSREVLKTLADHSIDSIVTDPPYALASIGKRYGKPDAIPTAAPVYARAAAGFMGKQWDTGETAFAVEFWAECLRVLKPGGHVVAFSGTRTYHRMACAIEDAGFEIRDQLQWIYGSGFPKSHDVSKGIDRTAGATREVVGRRPDWVVSDSFREAEGRLDRPTSILDITAPATDSAIQWQGWGTALKPACEPICFARKPLIGTVAANVLAHGTGAINIDGCRVGTDERINISASSNEIYGQFKGAETEGRIAIGRWPANILHDGSDEVIAAFPETQSGNLLTTHTLAESENGSMSGKNYARSPRQDMGGDSGSAARFFYTAKADANDRIGSKHPTVKPVDLMQWLCRLVTPKGGTILDPFAGTGTTGEAAFREGFNAVLIEREAEYQTDIRRRMALCMAGPDERKRESIKAKIGDLPFEPGSLFA